MIEGYHSEDMNDEFKMHKKVQEYEQKEKKDEELVHKAVQEEGLEYALEEAIKVHGNKKVYKITALLLEQRITPLSEILKTLLESKVLFYEEFLIEEEMKVKNQEINDRIKQSIETFGKIAEFKYFDKDQKTVYFKVNIDDFVQALDVLEKVKPHLLTIIRHTLPEVAVDKDVEVELLIES